MKKFTCFIILFCVFLGACKKPVQYPEIPEIKFVSFETLSQTNGLLAYYFQDGNGDLGLDEADLYPPFDTTSIYYYNFFCDCYEKQNGIFVKIDSTEANGVSKPFCINARFPRLSKLSKESINGELYHKMVPYREESPYDTVKLVFYIVDRALNHSNVEEVIVIRR